MASEASDPELLARQAAVSVNAVAEVRAALGAELVEQCSEQQLNQFLRATNCHPAQAAQRLRDTLHWRATEADPPERRVCATCLRDASAHYLHPVGFCRRRRPVLYSCMALARDRDIEANKRHMVATFEQAVRLMPPCVEGWVWFSDFHGFGMRDLSPSIGSAFLEISARHYPERLGLFLVVGAPRIFSGLWHVLQPLVDPVTRAKIKFLPADAKLRSSLRQYFDNELCNWLLTEMAQNRNKKLAAQKVYPYGWVEALDGSAGALVDGHDLRGTPAHLQAVASRPGAIVSLGCAAKAL
ncbi:hypothetical protein WJX81_005667 [Elliptochloris bilobata]|uniref:CRAL-TRIO domain-containing protein n=1 Tax=Elliptochloris bilobata TaxID=381761 RepID=A0AAW1SBK1_9CHLO